MAGCAPCQSAALTKPLIAFWSAKAMARLHHSRAHFCPQRWRRRCSAGSSFVTKKQKSLCRPYPTVRSPGDSRKSCAGILKRTRQGQKKSMRGSYLGCFKISGRKWRSWRRKHTGFRTGTGCCVISTIRRCRGYFRP